MDEIGQNVVIHTVVNRSDLEERVTRGGMKTAMDYTGGEGNM